MRISALGMSSWLLLAAACTDGEPGSATDDPPGPPPTDLEQSAALFAPDRVLDIDIELAPADWDALRTQTRSILDILGSSCLSPPESPFTYFNGTVTIDGERFDHVGVRKKG